MKFVNFGKKLSLIVATLCLGAQLSMTASAISRGVTTTTRTAQRGAAIPSRAFGSRTMRQQPIKSDARIIPSRSFSAKAPEVSSAELVWGPSKQSTTDQSMQKQAEQPPVVISPLDHQIARMEREMSKTSDPVARKRFQLKIDELRKAKQEQEQAYETQYAQQQQEKKSLWARFVSWLRSYNK